MMKKLLIIKRNLKILKSELFKLTVQSIFKKLKTNLTISNVVRKYSRLDLIHV